MNRVNACLRAFIQPGLSLRLGTASEEDRARERVRKAALTGLTAAAAKGIAVLTPLITLPLTLKLLGQERYGMWQTITAVTAMAAFADLGMGNGLLTGIARSAGRDDKEEAQRLVSSAFFMLIMVAGLVLAGVSVAFPWVNWTGLFNVTSPLAQSEAAGAMMACAFCFALNLPLLTVQKVQLGCQEGFQSNLWQCLGYIVTLGIVIACFYTKAGLPALVLGLMGTPVVIAALNGAVYFGRQRPWLRPAWRRFHAPTARGLLRTGCVFLIISMLNALAISSDNLIVAQLLGAETVTQLAVPARLASPLLALPVMVFTPMWSAYGEAISRGDMAWVRRNITRLVRLASLVTGAAAIVYVLAGPEVLRWLVGDFVSPSAMLMLGFGFWSVLLSVAGPGFMLLNAAKVLWPQVFMLLGFTTASMTVKVLLVSRFGVTVIPWITVLSYSVFVLVPLWWCAARVLRQREAASES
jgi:O-antigen/teichoic acid export membrane protein